MFQPEELILMTDEQMYASQVYSPHLQIEIPEMPEFGDFEDMPREKPILKKQLTDHLGDDNSLPDNEEDKSQIQFAQNSNASTPTLPDEAEEEVLEHITIIVCGYPYKITTIGLTDDEIEEQIEMVQNEALDFLLDGGDERYVA
jgi:hypothetical protein